MDLTFRALQDDFTGTWPAALRIENPEYTATLFYAGAGTDPSSDDGEYAADLAAGRLDRKNLTLNCKPKDQTRETNLDIIQGRVVLKPMPVMPSLTADEARHLADDLTAARPGAILCTADTYKQKGETGKNETDKNPDGPARTVPAAGAVPVADDPGRLRRAGS